jgi:uncharacterized RDD family membrane protein YckC
MKIMFKTRLLALTAMGWAMLCPSVALAHTADTNSNAAESGTHHEQLVVFGKDVELRAEDSAQEVVVIGGSAKIHGTVHGEVVVIGGNVDIDGHVEDQVVAVMGDVQLGETGKIDGQLVCVGGESHVAKGGKVRGDIVEVGAGMGLPGFLRLTWLRDWFAQCVMELRPLAPGVGWVWCVAGLFFIVYFLIAILFRQPVQCCAAQISARPATTFAAGILAKLAIPILCLVLPITVVGIVVVPFLIVGAFLTVLVGKAAVLECVGGKIGGGLGMDADRRPLIAFLIGAVLLTVLYVVPVIGLLTFCVFGCWGLGAGVTAICVALRANRPPPPAPAAAAPPPDMSVPTRPPLAPPQSLAYPRAGFWERMGAGFLDMVLVTMSSALVGPFFALVAIAYFSGMWAWKGTTVGGIVLNLQVVRQDGKSLSFLTAFVRSLAAFFSACVLFLGFFWIGWDPDKQGWHDKIAGTVVVRLPRAVSLVCY